MHTNWIRSVAVAAALGLGSLAGASSAATMPDAWITTKAKLALLTTEGISATKVNVDTIDGRVTLHGTVGSNAEKSKAGDVAKNIEGAREVRNLLQVVKGSQHDAKIADAKVKENVSAALSKDVALSNSKIEVASVNAGVVLLSGKAATLSDSLRAVEIASRIDGVRRVASEIESPDTVSDAEIWRGDKYDAKAATSSTAQDMWTTSAVKMRLLANSKTPGFDINVDTDAGAVTLFGVVDSQAAKDSATVEAKKVDGVRSVANELQVVVPSQQSAVSDSDDSIDDAVSKRLDESARLKDASIEVDVKNGVVHLTGDVASQSDRITALTVTRSTRGVRGLVDDLKIVLAPVSAR